MSEPKPINMIPRYTAVGTDVVKASESGELVLFSDYLALNKHCEWLDKRESFQYRVCKDFEAELSRVRAELKECKSQPDPLTAYLYAAELAKDEMKKLKDENDRLNNLVRYWSEKYKTVNENFTRAKKIIAEKDGKPSE